MSQKISKCVYDWFLIHRANNSNTIKDVVIEKKNYIGIMKEKWWKPTSLEQSWYPALYLDSPGCASERCLCKWRTVSSSMSAFSSLLCLVFSRRALSRISAFNAASDWFIRALRRFSISGLFACNHVKRFLFIHFIFIFRFMIFFVRLLYIYKNSSTIYYNERKKEKKNIYPSLQK